MARKVKYTVAVAYRVFDQFEVVLDEDVNENDALEMAERVASEQSLNDMECDHLCTYIVEREYVE